MSETVDCRGLACPEPVLLAREALQRAGAGTVTVLVSSGVARDNVSRAARQMGWSVAVENTAEGYVLTLSK
ncbi:MAG TPA: sulfurtransferase TusA family protein [Bacillota bacterium]|nr:sulfurtransferase TusA family protein [Bacillota bacterium]